METPNVAILLSLVDNIANAKAEKDGNTTIILPAEVKEQLVEASREVLAELQGVSAYVAEIQQPLFDMYAASALQGLVTDKELVYEQAANHAAAYAMHMLKARDEYVLAQAPQPEESSTVEPPTVIETVKAVAQVIIPAVPMEETAEYKRRTQPRVKSKPNGEAKKTAPSDDAVVEVVDKEEVPGEAVEG